MLRHTSAFWVAPSSENTAATLLPLASRIAPTRLPAKAPSTKPGTLATMKPRPVNKRGEEVIHISYGNNSPPPHAVPK